MARQTKRDRHNAALAEEGRIYPIEEAVEVLKKAYPSKFDPSVDVHIKLNADANASDQVVRGTTALPNGTGKKVRVIVITKDEAGSSAKEAGAEEVGGDELVQKIMAGWMDFDVVVASPSMMKDIAKLGRVLGPRGLMPSPKAGTVTDNLADAVKEIKKGRIEFKMDKQGNLHASVGRLSFESAQITENIRSFFGSVMNARPKTVKGDFVRSAYVSTTMGPGIRLDISEIVREGSSVE